MNLSEKERKLILLAFDSASHPPEAVSCFRHLAKIWMEKYQDGYEVIADLESGEQQRPAESAFANFEMPFGRHRGVALRDVPVSYLLWVLSSCDRVWPQTRMAIQRYLDSQK
jgi:Putative quorum-sensing-regulated virulence factor